MKDTAYFVPPAKIERLAHAYRSEGDRLVLFDEPATGKWSRPPTFEHGAAGLVSTVDDYLAFARMLLDATLMSAFISRTESLREAEGCSSSVWRRWRPRNPKTEPVEVLQCDWLDPYVIDSVMRYGLAPQSGFGTAGSERSEETRFPRDSVKSHDRSEARERLGALDDFRDWLVREAA